MKRVKPEVEEYEPFLSGHAFPDLLKRYSGNMTLEAFLNMPYEQVCIMTKEVHTMLFPLVDIFSDNQLDRANDRFHRLTDVLLEGGVDV